jgi:hypothetical protein
MFKKYEGYLYPLLAMFILFLIYIFIYSSNNYIDIFNFCAIDIYEDVHEGNKETIKVALKTIKNTDKSSYEDVCRYVELIDENLCPIDHAYGGAWTYNNQPGCYVKGSRVIYISPNQSSKDSIVTQRAQAIRKYAGLSKTYWLNSN